MSGFEVVETPEAWRIVLDRPQKGNALDRDMSLGLLDLVRDLASSDRTLVFESSAPGTFVAGADIEELRGRTVQDNLRLVNAQLFETIERHPGPTVAVVDGPALGGGCEFALCCDIRIATPRSTWGLPEVRLGLVPAAGGLVRLARLVGHGLAVDMILTGRRLDGTTAHQVGLCQRLCDTASLPAEVDTLIEELARPSRLAQQLAKAAMANASGSRRAVDSLAQALCILDPDTQARLTSFKEHSTGGGR